MPKVQLTAAAVERLKAAPGVRTEYFDKLLPGFALRVSGPTTSNPAGSKSWVVFYRFGGKLRRDTIGKWPVLELAEAREKARKMLAAVSEDRDPHPTIQQKHSVESVVDEFISRHLTAHRRSASYIKETRRIFDAIALPRWRGRALEQITRRDVMELLDEVADGRASINSRNGAGKGAPIMANRVLATLRAFFRWSVGRGLIETSPVSNIPRPAGENPRDRVLSDEEIVYFWNGCDTLGWPFGPMFKLLLLTAQRRDEVGGARWPEIDLDKRLWTIPRERAKNDRTHEVHLSELALEILSELPKISRSRADGAGSEPSPYLFTTSGERPVSGFSKAKERLDGHMLKLLRVELGQAGGDPDAAAIDPWILHDLRRTAATGMARLNIAPHVVDRILNHVSGTIRGVAAVYNRHAYLEERKSALEAWARYVESLVRPTPANVLPLVAAR
jgi:integrase